MNRPTRECLIYSLYVSSPDERSSGVHRSVLLDMNSDLPQPLFTALVCGLWSLHPKSPMKEAAWNSKNSHLLL